MDFKNKKIQVSFFYFNILQVAPLIVENKSCLEDVTQ